VSWTLSRLRTTSQPHLTGRRHAPNRVLHDKYVGQAVGTEIYDHANTLGGFAKLGQPYLLEHPVADNGRGT
jgi:hypothetical protein